MTFDHRHRLLSNQQLAFILEHRVLMDPSLGTGHPVADVVRSPCVSSAVRLVFAALHMIEPPHTLIMCDFLLL